MSNEEQKKRESDEKIDKAHYLADYVDKSKIGERFKKPTDKQLVDIAIIFNDGRIDEVELSNIVSAMEFVVDRLYENGDVSIPCKWENETAVQG